MNTILKLLLLSTIVILVSCRGERWDDDLTLPQQDYNGNELRINGYYYNESDGKTEILFLYQNGTVLDGGTSDIADLSSLEQDFMDGTHYSFALQRKYYWGRFIVEGTKIQREFWKPNTGPFEAWIHEGEILNDTTFKMVKSWRSCKPKKKKDFERIFHFKQFAPKPDSTNSYTK